jgi:hypothetical protein
MEIDHKRIYTLRRLLLVVLFGLLCRSEDGNSTFHQKVVNYYQTIRHHIPEDSTLCYVRNILNKFSIGNMAIVGNSETKSPTLDLKNCYLKINLFLRGPVKLVLPHLLPEGGKRSSL